LLPPQRERGQPGGEVIPRRVNIHNLFFYYAVKEASKVASMNSFLPLFLHLNLKMILKSLNIIKEIYK